MQITTIIENENLQNREKLQTQSGLSFYIELDDQKILFDAGTSVKMIENARELKVPLEDIDLCIISHGHFDHAGALVDFLKINSSAKVLLSEHAKGDFYFKKGPIKKPVGIPKQVFEEFQERLTFLTEDTSPLSNLHIHTDIQRTHPLIKGNLSLKQLVDGQLIQDDFRHEIMTVVETSDGIVLITGCSHNGITNMIEMAQAKYPDKPIQAVFGGFHLMGIPLLKNSMSEKPPKIQAIGKALSAKNIPKIYTMHCTGMKAFGILQSVMGDSIQYLSTGETIQI